MTRILLILLLGAFACSALPAQAQTQKYGGDWAWKPMLKHEGVEFKYIFYAEADNENNGVVVLLINHNDYRVYYEFKIIFRAGEAEVVKPVVGVLDAKQAKTGDTDGLFWIPFPDGRSIGEVGLRGDKIFPKAKKRTKSSVRG